MRLVLGVLVLFGALASPARAAEPAPKNELTFDLGAASIGMTHAWRTSGGRVLIGGGGAMGLYPLLGALYATGTHFDNTATVNFAELMHLQLFARIEPASWLRVDGGVRAGVFAHAANDSIAVGTLAGLFVAPALVWRWLWVGPRISGNLIWEQAGPNAGLLEIEYVIVRLVRSW